MSCPFPGFLTLSRVFAPSPAYLTLVCLLIAALSLADLRIASCVSPLPRQLVPCCRIATPSLGLSHAGWLIAAYVSPLPLASCPFCARFPLSWLLAICRLAYCCVVSCRLANRFLCFAPFLTTCSLQAGLLLRKFCPFLGYLFIFGLLFIASVLAPSLATCPLQACFFLRRVLPLPLDLFIEGWLIVRFCASLFPRLLLNGRSVPYLGMEQ